MKSALTGSALRREHPGECECVRDRGQQFCEVDNPLITNTVSE
jgi:hypothetical protein